MLDDEKNLLLLKNICSGRGVSVNVSVLSKLLRKHRNTVKERVAALLERGIIDRPVFPFIHLLNEYPLLVVTRADLPHSRKIEQWMKEDERIFASFKIREEEFNTMRFEFHTDLYDHYMWRESLVEKGVVPSRDTRSPSSVLFFSNRLIVKYKPSIGLNLIAEEIEKQGYSDIDGYELKGLDFEILKHLLEGRAIKVNESLLSREVGLSRRALQNRILKMTREGIILNPLCRFPLFFVPPGFILAFSLIEMKKHREDILVEWMKDPHLSIIYKTSTGRYNFLLFANHRSVEDHLMWEEKYSEIYPGCFGMAAITLLTPKMKVSIDQQKVSLGIIERRLKQFRRKRPSN
jgi:DNA-binding Lrp family transcriptional regulator